MSSLSAWVRRSSRLALLILFVTLLPLTASPPATTAQSANRCFEETGFCISGRIREYWEQNGGLPVFGLPITPQRAEVIEGQSLQVQWFERNRLELHPENAPPFDVLLGRLGADTLAAQGRDWFDFPQELEPRAGCRYFAETRQNVCGAILAAWQAQGLNLDGQPGFSEFENLALWGLPLSPVQTEVLEGREYQVQWFERARFELHPENNPPFDVLLGLLGTDLLAGNAGQPSEPTTPEPPRPPDITSPNWPQLRADLFAGGLVRPVSLTHAGDNSGRLFVIEQEGRIRIIDRNGNLLPEPFLDLTDRVSCCGERGLLSVAFPPTYTRFGEFFVNYTTLDKQTHISRFRVSSDPNRADRSSEQVILAFDQPFANHNGGQMAFGPNDGYLYIGTGDGGSGGDPDNRSQRLNTLLGKILRIDVQVGATYTIPPDNPFVNTPDARPEIWALGLRNPWRFSFDPANGNLFIADVGQDMYEEINFQASTSRGGENYGWKIMEGNECFGTRTCDRTGLTMPIITYDHSDDDCSVTGGYVYRGTASQDMQGIYFYGDFCSGRIWGLRNTQGRWETRVLLREPITISSFGTDQAGNLYVVSYNDGTIYRLTD